jgi:signal transduction histidine kinase
MIRLLIRFLVVAIIITTVTAFSLNKIYLHIQFKNACKNTMAIQFIPNMIKETLKPYPVSQWQHKLNQMVKNPRAINVVKVGQVGFTDVQLQQLKQHKWTCLKNKVDQTFDATYQLIPGSQRVFRVNNDLSDSQTAQYKLSIAQKIIEENLKKRSPSQWPQYIHHLAQKMHLPTFMKSAPLAIHEMKDINLSESDKQKLLTDQWLVLFPTNSVTVNTVYGYIPSLKRVIQYGPYQTDLGDSFAQYKAFTFLIIALEILALIIGFLFAISVSRLNRLAKQYGKGEFSKTIKLNRYSILYPLFENLRLMGKRIKNLIVSHKDLNNAIAHELRTPISRMRFSMKLLKNAKDLNQLDHRLESVNEDLDELEDLISEILFYSQVDRIISEKLDPLRLQPVLMNFLERFSAHLDHHKLIINFSSALKNVHIKTNEKYFLRIIQNILNNANRFAKSTIKISVTQQDGSDVVISIEDDGPGIDPEDKQTLFNAFTQLNNQASDEKQGYGLGLAIVKKIVDQYHWTINVEQSSLGGANFKLLIPIASQA